MRFALPRDPSGLDPATVRFGPDELQVARVIFDPLLTIDESSELRPGLATEVSPNSDLTEWTIILRQGVTFSDGSPVDAMAVKSSLDAARHSAALGPLLEPVDDIRAIDNDTVVAILRTPWAAFPQMLAGQPGFVSSPQMRLAADPARAPVGSGPFVLDRWEAGRELVLTKRVGYWQDGLPRLDRVTFVVSPDDAARFAAVRQGEVDVARLVDPAELARASMDGGDGFEVLKDKSDDTPELVIVLNTAAPPFNDRSARAALAFSIDRDTLSREVFNGEYLRADGPFSEGSRFYGEAHWPILDVAHAADLVRDHERRNGRPVEFRLTIGPGPLAVELARRIIEQTAVVGILAEIEVADSEEQLSTRVARGDFQAAVLALFDGSHPDEDYALLHGGSGVPRQGVPSANLARFNDPSVDVALDAARRTLDVTAQAERYQQLQKVLAEQLPYVFLVHVQSALIVGNAVRGLADWRTPTGEPGIRQWRSTVWLGSVWLEPSGGGEPGTSGTRLGSDS
ncbi:MAG: ABC transporter substrate-binding protein [Acidimicrobiales bacterium]|nr:ABC transporter substrate-binding protein [Acidimicrobiales bacterium]